MWMRRAVGLAVVWTVAFSGTTNAQSLSPESVGGFWDQGRSLVNVVAPGDDPGFYEAPAGVDVSAIPPGSVLRDRALNYHVAGIETPVRVVQLLYTTVNALGEPAVNVTSVIEPPGPADNNVVAYQSFYDSLNPADNPSRIIAGNQTVGGLITTFETTLIAPALLAGHRVVLADVELADASFAAGPAYGRATLDSLRAATASPATGITDTDRIGMIGYSGGAIASNWAAILMDSYAPELRPRTVGVAQGGVLVNPIHNLGYAGEGPLWATVVGMALIGIARSYDVDVVRYLNDYGRVLFDDVKDLSIVEAFGRYPHVRWADIAKPEYPTVESAPELRPIIESLNMGTAPVPTMPMLIVQGAGGHLEGTAPQIPGVGAGDGVMVAGDVRSLARRYCDAGTVVDYREHPGLSHIPVGLVWAVDANIWIEERFRGVPAGTNCGSIPPGNNIGGR